MLDLDLCARVKQISLSPLEQLQFHDRAAACAAQCGRFKGPVQVSALALSDQTQTYRLTSREGSAVLKLLSPAAATLTLRVQDFFRRRDVAFPEVLWSDRSCGAILYEDCGTSATPARPDEGELTR